MTTLTKMDMIKALVAANQVDELKKEKDDSIKLAARIFRTVSNDRVKELYATRIAANPEKVIEEVTKKAEKAAKASKKAAQKKPAEKVPVKEEPVEKDAMYQSIEDEEGNVYKKAWMLEELNSRGFSKLTNRNIDVRRLKGEHYLLIYSRFDNKITVKELGTGKVVKTTLCICPFIVRAFIDKYMA